MANFKISAPGRIVLSGEHSAMYRKLLITTSLDLRTRLEFCELPDERKIEIYFPDVNVHINIPLENVQSFFSRDASEKSNLMFVLRYVKSLITFNGMWTTYKQKFSLIIFFFLFYTIAIEQDLDVTSFRVKVSTNIPIGAGFGSSTSFMVCLAACFLHWKDLQTGNLTDFNNIQFLDDVATHSFVCMEFVKNYEFGQVDVAVCVHGVMLKSQLIDSGFIDNIGSCKNQARMKILLIDSGIRQEKRRQEEKMAQLKSESSETFDVILNRLNRFAMNMYAWLDLISFSIQNANIFQWKICYDKLQKCIRWTQLLLRRYDLSCEVFNRIFEIAQNMGYSAKLTGFGPRYAYLLLPPNITDDEIEEILMQLRDQNFTIIGTSINCDGVTLDN
ncbi:mevalonate kinase-like [Nylanderia fulva]|uniref:mevalonate kinase-like n=1 Tax=Nylanderia fulva TaxID=613905 RepID=UPI0010FB718B|nr:mevalonate kinase-like [Nylanderia fulva]